MALRKRFPYLVELLTIAGLAWFAAQSWYYANTLDSIGDEGSYLYKGYLFARGDYEPFQEYTFWTNKAPLSFLIPGYIQLWFGPSLQVGRMFAVFLAVLMMIAIWITANRLGGRVWGALAVWVFALSFAQISVYSEAVSQGLVACMLAWMFVLTLGGDRPLWQLVLGSALAVLIVMTRQNMVVVPLLLVAYIFWQYGKRAGWWAFGTSAALFLLFHLLYWPGIWQIWAPWLPPSLTPFLDPFRVNAQLSETDFVFEATTLSRLRSLATGLHDHYFILLGSVSALIFWPRREGWRSTAHFKMAVFLGTTFFLLFVMHTLASLPTDYCVHCFSAYHAFYSTAGFFFILVVFSNGLQGSPRRLILLVPTLLIFAAALGLYYYQRWGDWLLSNVQVPRLNRLIRQAEFSTVSLRDVLTHTFALSNDIQRRVASVGAGIFIGVLLILLLWVLYRLSTRKEGWARYSLVNVILAGALLVGTLLPAALRTPAGEAACAYRFLTYYEEAGRTLADLVPAGSLVYWRGSGRHLAFMLYLDDVELFLPQIHAGGGYAVGETDELLRFGLFNEELDLQWRESADILMVWDTYLTKEFQAFLDQSTYEEVAFDMGNLARCEDPLYVFRKTS